MGTRGVMGFVVDGQEKLAYNHWDSYPSGTGVDVLKWLREQDATKLAVQAAAIRVIDGATPPTPEDVDRLAPWTDLGVSRGSTQDWYCLLRGTQGDMAAMTQAGVMEDAGTFPLDSLFCEWGYVVDLDAGTFEVYEGFQEKPHDAGQVRHPRRNGEPVPADRSSSVLAPRRTAHRQGTSGAGRQGWRLTPAEVLALPMGPNDAKAVTVRDYFVSLLAKVWEEGEGFNGKRPFGNSGWHWDLIETLESNGLPHRTDPLSHAEAYKLIGDAIQSLRTA